MLSTQRHHTPRRGVILLAVLVVVVLMSLAAYQYSEYAVAELQAAEMFARSVQSNELAKSGLDYALATLGVPDNFTGVLGGNPFDNPTAFQGIPIPGALRGTRQGFFSIVTPLDVDEVGVNQSFRYGCEDESGKINLNALLKIDSSGQVAFDMLMKLPGADESLVNAVLDYLDPDEETRTDGAENDYYQSLSNPYSARNGPLDSLEELLFVRGMTPEILFGNDANRNGSLDRDENDGTNPLDRGWAAYLTVHSRERNVDAANAPRVNVNEADLTTLATNLDNAGVDPELANFILAYRLYGSGNASGGGATGGASGGTTEVGVTVSSSGDRTVVAVVAQSNAPRTVNASGPVNREQLDLSGQGNNRLASLYDLVGAQVSIPGRSQQEPTTIYRSPMADQARLSQLLPTALDKLTTQSDTELPPRININTAPQAVLLALPGLTETDVLNIVDSRPDPTLTDPTDPVYNTPAWLMLEADLPAETLKTLERYVTARTQTYRVQVLGYFEGGGPTARLEAVIDTNGGRPRVIYYRDLTELGKGFDP